MAAGTCLGIKEEVGGLTISYPQWTIFLFLWGKAPEFLPQSHADPLTSQRDKETDQLRPPTPSSGWRRIGYCDGSWKHGFNVGKQTAPEAAVLIRGIPLLLFSLSVCLLWLDLEKSCGITWRWWSLGDVWPSARKPGHWACSWRSCLNLSPFFVLSLLSRCREVSRLPLPCAPPSHAMHCHHRLRDIGHYGYERKPPD